MVNNSKNGELSFEEKKMARKQKTRRWYPVRPIKPQDHFVSSNYKDCLPFVPSYDKDKVNMFLLMAHDYAKLWKSENKVEEKIRFEFAGEENERLCRRYVLRALQNKRKVAETKPRFIMKRFQNIPSKVRQFMYPDDAPQVRGSAVLKDSHSKITHAKDSKDLIWAKQKSSERANHEQRCDAADIAFCRKPVRCDNTAAVSSSTSASNILELKGSSQKSNLSEMDGAPNQFRVDLYSKHVHG